MFANIKQIVDGTTWAILSISSPYTQLKNVRKALLRYSKTTPAPTRIHGPEILQNKKWKRGINIDEETSEHKSRESFLEDSLSCQL